MSVLIPIIDELLINLAEAILFFYLIAHRLSLRQERKKLLPIGLCIDLLSVTLFNFTISNTWISMIITLVLEIGLTFLFTDNSVSEKIVWGSAYMMIVTISDYLTITLVKLFVIPDVTLILSHTLFRYQMQLVYLLLCAIFVFTLSHIKQEALYLPFYLKLLFLFLAFTSIVVSNLLLKIAYTQNFSAAPNIEILLYTAIFSFLAVSFFMILLIELLGKSYQRNLLLIAENTLQKHEQAQYELLSDTAQTLRTWKHDYKNHLNVIQQLLAGKNYDDCVSYVTELEQNLILHNSGIYTGNLVLDAVLSSRMNQIKKQNILFDFTIYLPERFPITNVQLSALLGNLLDNALESNIEANGSVLPFIHLEIKPYQDSLYICMKNSCNGRYNIKDQKLLSTKNEAEHGIGTKRIQQIAEDAGGFCRFLPEKTTFTATIILPLNT